MQVFYKNNYYLIESLYDFKELMDEEVYFGIVSFIKENYIDEIEGLQLALSDAEDEIDSLNYQLDDLESKLEELENE